jgi:hypothetical protein
MKTHRNYLVAGGLLALTLALPCRSAAAPAQTIHFRFQGLSADAFFDSFDVTGCVETDAGVSAVDGRIKMMGGGPEVTSSAFVFISQYDNCSQTVLLNAFGSATLPAGAFQIDKKLTSATLHTSVDVFDSVSGTTFPTDISLSWTGTGPISAEHNHFIFRTPGFRENETFSGKFNPATASGSVTAGGTNFSPSPAVSSADLDDVKEGNLDVLH